MGERNFLFFNSCLEWQALSEGVEGCFAASEVVRAICETDFQEQGTILNNPKTDYYHKYVKTPHDGMFLMSVSRPAAQTNIHVFIDTRLSPNGVYWFLRWTCNYPVDSQKCCERIQALQLPIPEGYACSYENIRNICKLSFMEYDANKLDQVKVSKFDLGAFAVCREIVLKMTEELEKICLASA